MNQQHSQSLQDKHEEQDTEFEPKTDADFCH
jgi:hypothetical protein